MILLRANPEVKNTFDKVIQTMGEPVEWTGLFAVIDNYLILQGEVRSLFFNFDSRKVVSNIIDLPVREDQVLPLEAHPKVLNVINMVLYTFGKWGTIKGLKVEQDYAQLNHLFSKILSEIYVEPGFSRENFRFYKEGIRITYEDVIQLMIEAQKKPLEEPEVREDEKQGLWHKLIWKKVQCSFLKVETTLAERQKERLGHNFYMVGYQCPTCKEKLHMVVFPTEQELLVETDEGRVYLARAYTCDKCNCFYTPRPEKLLAEGDCYEMPFGEDRKAYEDYLELLGEKGDYTSNYKYNEYEMVRKAREKQQKGIAEEQGMEPKLVEQNQNRRNEQEAVAEFEDLCTRLSGLSAIDFSRLKARIEEGFFPLELVKKHDKQVAEQTKAREIKKKESKAIADAKNYEDEKNDKVQKSDNTLKSENRADQPLGQKPGKEQEQNQNPSGAYDAVVQGEAAAKTDEADNASQSGARSEAEQKAVQQQKEKIKARINILERLSERQRKELTQQIQQDKKFTQEEKEELLQPIRKREQELKIAELEKKAENFEHYNYTQMQRVIEEIEQAKVPAEWKEKILSRLHGTQKERGEAEVKQLMEKIPFKLDRKGYQSFMARLLSYQGIDLSPYQDILNEKREVAEKQEIANVINGARKISREDMMSLLKRLKEGDFLPETLRPYEDKLKEKVREMDEKVIAQICESPFQMDFGEAMNAYEQIEQGDFLPELKINALEMLSKRLSKIKTDECELLVHKLKDELQGAVKENPRHYFYPARKILMKEATEEDTKVIDYALATYATKRNLFEYPILVVDTSRNGSGKEGMILTPEHLFYSTLLSAYDMPIDAIRSIKCSTGLLNRGITVEQKNGTKTKIPYAVETNELKSWTKVLGDFISYLQEKPQSRDVTYLAKEKHETICCFRCGYTYKGGNVCPKCGYKMNQ